MNFTRDAISDLQQRRTAPLTPLIDVVFLLLIFLLFGDFRHQEGQISSRVEAADAPGAGAAGQMLVTVRQEAGVASVKLSRPGEPQALYTAGIERLETRQVLRALRAAGVGDPANLSAVIATEGQVDFRHVMTLWDRCRQLGFGDIGLQAARGEP